MPRTRALAAVLTAAVAAAAPPGPPRILPKTVTLHQPSTGTLAAALTAVRDQTGLAVSPAADVGPLPYPADLDAVPVWDALGRIAGRTGTRLVLHDHGRRVELARATGLPAVASADGPFRVAVRQVRAVADLDSGQAFTELALDLHWEPRVPVFRVEAQPTLTTVEDDRGSRIGSDTARAKTPPTGALHATTVRLTGIPRSAAKLTRVAGTFTVTAADRMLLFPLGELSKLPVRKEQDGIAVAVTRVERIEDRVEVQVELTYPPDTPEFESFESFAARNEARLVAVGKADAVWTPADTEESSNGRRVIAVYRFAESAGRRWEAAAWRFEYTTPAPLSEFPVRFELRDVVLP